VSQTSLLKSSAFRITLVYILLFGLSVSIILGFVYWSTIIYKTNQTDEDINAEIQALSETYETRGYPGLLTMLSERIEQQRPGDTNLYLLTDNQFRPLVQNISGWPRLAKVEQGDWLVFDFDVGTKEYSARARTFVVEGRFNLLVGKSMRDLATLNALVGRALIWGLILTLVLGIIGGLMMRQTLSSRLSSINQTSREIMQGHLRRRIDTSGTGDEFDQLANNLNSMLDQIEHGMEGVRRVSDNIAHDLKTPLARLKNKVEELKFEVAGNKYHETKIELIEERGQSLIVEISKPMKVFADRDMLFQAFANLLDNAIKYTPQEGKIHIRSYTEKRQWHIEISDNGPGIPEEEHEKVVQRFYRLDQSRTTPGSGLGLALVFAVLKLHKLDLKFINNKPGLKVRVTCSQHLAINNRKPMSRNTNDDVEETSLMI